MSKVHNIPYDPTLVPVTCLDMMTGQIACLGALSAILKRSQTGGSYLVQASLAQTALYIRSLGLYQEDESMKIAAEFPVFRVSLVLPIWKCSFLA